MIRVPTFANAIIAAPAAAAAWAMMAAMGEGLQRGA
jgi:hypothetical protein